MDFNLLKTLEVLGLISGITYLIGSILEKKWCWYAGIIATILYAIQVYLGKLFGEFILQFFYLGISFYGLYLWTKRDKSQSVKTFDVSNPVVISYSSFFFLLKVILVGTALSGALYYALISLNSTYPFWDAITSGFGITTTYLTAKKKIENWIFWILIDIILAYILYLKTWHFYSLLYAIYALFAIIGWWRWHNEYKKKPFNSF